MGNGPGEWGRTITALRPHDFESCASASSATPGLFADALAERTGDDSDNILYLRCASRRKWTGEHLSSHGRNSDEIQMRTLA